MPSPKLQTAIALVRGINVGGKNPLPMPTLRALCESLGWTNVTTHMQSGNVVFTAPTAALGPRGAKAAASLEDAIEQSRSFRPTVVIRTAAELRTCLAANPFAREAARDPKLLLVMFLAAAPTSAARKAVLALRPDPERLALAPRELFLWYPTGIGESMFQFSRVEKAIQVPGTTRNWNTITKLLELAAHLETKSR